MEMEPKYVPTRQIQVANLRWKYRGIHPICNKSIETEDVIKVEVWDVVDHGVQEQSQQHSEHGLAIGNSIGVLDAEAVDVYKHSNGVVFLFNLCKPRTIEYVAKQLPLVPRTLPILIIGNFADKIYAQEDESFLIKRFAAIRGDTALSAPLHFMCGSLTQPNCPSNPAAGLLTATLKFFELPFLQLQQTVLTGRLKINEEQIERAKREWNEMINPMEMSPALSILTIPEAARTNTNLGSLDSVSTDTLTLASRTAWND
ncbi:GTP-binding protein Parf [Paramicrosporidium saccamoebae]|uniref:GTP-binding protein Parf n=1 Tax=Paramicrosporidium saccamoebae TaxID=1246581 RepID=A0A2H9TQA3_9FUNG|nr:GTP-binding protein Parf [Paramicrosporidium saccamoebae]